LLTCTHVMRRLFGMNVDIELQKKKRGRTPLSLAAENGHEAVIKLLLETDKVNVSSMSHYGWTPLSWAADKGHEGVVKLLLEANGIDVETEDDGNQTPLSRAARNRHESIVKLLQKGTIRR
jgi:ankyrin repeat protein